VRRATLGIIALVLLVVGVTAALRGPGGESAWGFSGVCIKSGLVLGALWLALPQLQAMFSRLPSRVFGYFLGKKKDSPATNTPSAEPRPPQPRPRRRSNR
jgi:hypothetical protein